MPWFLRWTTAVLRPLGRLVSNAAALGSAILQPIRQRLNQWNWRKKTALVTALTIIGGGVFYKNRAHAAAFAWPVTIAASVGIDFLVSVAASYASSSAINSKIKKTANANPDGDPLYYNREYYERDYDVDASGTQTENYRIDADADALYQKAYDTSGTNSRLSPSTLEQGEILYLVGRNANLNGFEVTYEVLVL